MAVVSTLLIASAFALVYKLAQWVVGTLRPKNFPPGPPIIPGLGNLLDIPLKKPYLQFDKWARQYGDLVGIKTGTSNLVIINSPALVSELFDKRGAVCSDRPNSHFISKYVAYGEEERHISILQYDDYYRRWRKSLQPMLSSAGISQCLPLLEAEASSLCYKIMEGNEGDIVEHLDYWSFAVPFVLIVGERLHDMPPQYLGDFLRAQNEVVKLATPGVAPPVDIFPILKYVPEFFSGWKKHARWVREIVVEDASRLRKSAEKQFEQIQRDPGSVAYPSYMAKIMQDQQGLKTTVAEDGFTPTQLGYAGQAVAAAATETTAATMKNLLATLAAYPHIMAKAQKEVDLIGNGSPPTFEQVHGLTYLRACISEILRWRPTTPNAFPHVLTRNENVGNYHFPAGTVFIANVWTIHHNEDEYESPNEFIPERFLQHPLGLRREAVGSMETSASTTATSPGTHGRKALYAFGSGRRQCPGENFAFAAISITLAKLLWAYDLLPPQEGVDLSIETGFTDGLLSAQVNPRVQFKLRDEKRQTLLKSDIERTSISAEQILGR